MALTAEEKQQRVASALKQAADLLGGEQNMTVAPDLLVATINRAGYAVRTSSTGTMLCFDSSGENHQLVDVLKGLVEDQKNPLVKDRRSLRAELRAVANVGSDEEHAAAQAQVTVQGVLAKAGKDTQGLPLAIDPSQMSRGEKIALVDRIGSDEYAARHQRGLLLLRTAAVASDSMVAALATPESAQMALNTLQRMSEPHRMAWRSANPGVERRLIDRACGKVVD